MPVVLPHPLTDGTVAYGSQVRGNDDALASKFSEGPGGIGDADISTTGGVSATKLSTSPGKRLDEARLEDDAVSARVLRDDATVDANRAVTRNHCRDALVNAAKLDTDAVIRPKVKRTAYSVAASTLFGVGSIAGGGALSASTGLIKANISLLGAWLRHSTGWGGSGERGLWLAVNVNGGTGALWADLHNHGLSTYSDLANIFVEIEYIPNS